MYHDVVFPGESTAPITQMLLFTTEKTNRSIQISRTTCARSLETQRCFSKLHGIPFQGRDHVRTENVIREPAGTRPGRRERRIRAVIVPGNSSAIKRDAESRNFVFDERSRREANRKATRETRTKRACPPRVLKVWEKMQLDTVSRLMREC